MSCEKNSPAKEQGLIDRNWTLRELLSTPVLYNINRMKDHYPQLMRSVYYANKNQ